MSTHPGSASWTTPTVIACAALGIALLGTGVALGGPAVAVAATIVNLADPTTPANKAHVDTSGRVLVSQKPLTSTLALNGSFYNVGTTPLTTTPTTASLVITGFGLAETRLNGTANGADLTPSLVQFAATDSTTCSATTYVRVLYRTELSAGQAQDVAGSSRLEVKPVGGAAYCLGISSSVTNGAADQTPYYPRYNFTAYVSAGNYTGAGTANQPAVVNDLGKKQ